MNHSNLPHNSTLINMYPNTQQSGRLSPAPLAVVAPAHRVSTVWSTDPFRYYMPRPPRFMGTLYAHAEANGLLHYQPIYYYQLHTGAIVYRTGPCLTCSPAAYEPRLNFQHTFSNAFPQAQTQTQAVNSYLTNAYSQTSIPQFLSRRTVPVVQSAAIRDDIITAQPSQELPQTTVADLKVKQEAYPEGVASLSHRRSFRDQVLSVEPFDRIFEIGKANWIKQEKVQRICEWRDQVQPVSGPDCDLPDGEYDGDSKACRGGAEFGVKRKAEEGCDDATVGKRPKLETKKDPFPASTSLTTTRSDPKTKACSACRRSHKKCDGKLSSCLNAPPKNMSHEIPISSSVVGPYNPSRL